MCEYPKYLPYFASVTLRAWRQLADARRTQASLVLPVLARKKWMDGRLIEY